MLSRIDLVPAKIDKAKSIKELINLSYRGKEGWTRETEIVAGARVSYEDIKSLIQRNDSKMLIASISGEVIACICIEKKENKVYIGSFAVAPSYQNMGIGKLVLSQAEDIAVNQMKAKEIVMTVISQRRELIEYYERRGYRRTGQTEKYPVHLNVGTPIVEGLTIEYLVKYI